MLDKVLLNQLLSITKSQIKALEILDLINNNKLVVRQLYKDEKLIKQFCKNFGLSIIISPIKIKLLDSENTYSNKGFVTQSDTDDTFKLVYIAKLEENALKASLAELEENDEFLGLLLSYPKCCIDFFFKYKNNIKQNDFNYENIILKEIENNKIYNNNNSKKQFYFGMNIFKREEDACLLSHFPCSLKCEKSKNIAKKRFEMLKEYNLVFAKELKNKLKGKIYKYEKEVNFI